ncbi:MAG: DUF5060 domain-containing protein [Anaerolineales bacterium]
MPSLSPAARITTTGSAVVLAAAALIASAGGEASGGAPADRHAAGAGRGTATKIVLFADSFNRPNSETIGNGWIENEARGARGAIEDQRLCFVETTDLAVRPQVLHGFEGGEDGLLEWRFEFDWARIGPDPSYLLFLQLGDGSLMDPNDPHRGIAINLVWTAVDGVHETLASYHAGTAVPLTVLSGQASVVVVVDPASGTYEVRVDRTTVGNGIPFQQVVALNTIRVLTSQLEGANFQGRCFDSLAVSRREGTGPSRPTPTATSPGPTASPLNPSATPSPTPGATSTPQPTPTSTSPAAPSPTSSPTGIATPTSLPGTYSQWSRVEVALRGPASVGMGDTVNPFAIFVDVAFTAPDGTLFLVPAFYDGDGLGGMDGDVWVARLSPSQAGMWSYRTESLEPLLDGHEGTFEVLAPSGCSPYLAGGLPDFGCLGRLSYTGGHFLQFAAGPYWLKGGVDDPEDFLAPGNTVGFASRQEAIEFLASYRVNSLYMLLHNVGGDAKNVWPWAGSTQAEAQAYHEHFNVAKLAEWEEVFSYLQAKGIVLHLVLEDDSAWTGFNRGMYYREMVARFGHHPGLIWNLAEEYNETYSPSQIQTFAGQLLSLDPYDHPITVHHAGGLSSWTPFVGHPDFALTSFQTSDVPQNAAAESWFSTVQDSGRPIPISFDETGKLSASERDLARHIVWSVYLGGGNFELHASPLSSYQDFALHFEDLGRARTFMEGLPFCEMRPMNGRLLSGLGYVAGRAEDVLAVYLPSGGTIELDLQTTSGWFHGTWFEPSSGNTSAAFPADGGGILSLTSPFSGESALALVGDLADVSTCR